MKDVKKMNTIWTICLVLWCVSLFCRSLGILEMLMLSLSSVGVLIGLIPMYNSRKETSVSTKLLYGMFMFLVLGKLVARLGFVTQANFLTFISALFFMGILFKLVVFMCTHDYRRDVKEVEELDDDNVSCGNDKKND